MASIHISRQELLRGKGRNLISSFFDIENLQQDKKEHINEIICDTLVREQGDNDENID